MVLLGYDSLISIDSKSNFWEHFALIEYFHLRFWWLRSRKWRVVVTCHNPSFWSSLSGNVLTLSLEDSPIHDSTLEVHRLNFNFIMSLRREWSLFFRLWSHRIRELTSQHIKQFKSLLLLDSFFFLRFLYLLFGSYIDLLAIDSFFTWMQSFVHLRAFINLIVFILEDHRESWIYLGFLKVFIYLLSLLR